MQSITPRGNFAAAGSIPAHSIFSTKIMKNHTNYLLIGDIHSQYAPLRKALDYAFANDLKPVLLGDIFDSRCDKSDTVQVYNLLKSLHKEGKVVILRSNHQDKIEKFSLGIAGHQPEEMFRTVDDFEKAGISLSTVNDWLQTFPYGFCFKDHEGTEFRCAHAMFPSWFEVPDYEQEIYIYPEKRQVKKLMMYGAFKEDRKRIFWWESVGKRDWVRVAGHYHTIHQTEKSLVLDGGCGGVKRSWFCNAEPVLVAYDTLKKEIVRFDVN